MWSLSRFLAPLAWVLIAFSALGCQRSSAPGPTGSPVTPKTTTALQAEIEGQLKSALYQLQPENLGIDSRLDDAVSVLNNWWSAVKAAGMEPTGLTPPPIPAGRIPDDIRPRFETETFDLEDGRHIRAAYLAKSVADQISSQTEDDLERVVRTFEWVCHNVVMVADDDPQPPLTFYEVLVSGRGRAADRAWVFGEILKQLRIDTVAIRGKEVSSGPFLVGVLLEKDVYLFDPLLGLPLPRGDEPVTPRITKPATLADIVAHPDWLKPLAARTDQPYEITAEHLANPKLDAITSVDAWCPRMWKLEQLLPGESLCFLYEAPDTLGDAPGVFDRIAAAQPGWTADDIGVWTYPLQRIFQFTQMQLDPNAIRMAQAVMAPLAAPVEVRPTENGAPRAVETMGQLKIRTLQLKGNHEDAIAHFVTIRQLSVKQPPVPEWGPIYQRAAEDAYFWSCLSKYELGEWESAVTSLNDYLKRYRRGRWVGPAALLLAECHRELKQLPEAVQALKTAGAEDAYRATAAILAKRWAEDQ